MNDEQGNVGQRSIWTVLVVLAVTIGLVLIWQYSLEVVLSWLDLHQGAISAVLTLVLVVTTIQYTRLTRQTVVAARRQLEAEVLPRVFLYWIFDAGLPSVRLSNHGNYPIFLHDYGFYAVLKGKIFPLGTPLVVNGLIRIDPGQEKELPISDSVKAFQGRKIQLHLPFSTGGTGNQVHTYQIGLRVDSKREEGLEILDAKLLRDWNPFEKCGTGAESPSEVNRDLLT